MTRRLLRWIKDALDVIKTIIEIIVFVGFGYLLHNWIILIAEYLLHNWIILVVAAPSIVGIVYDWHQRKREGEKEVVIKL